MPPRWHLYKFWRDRSMFCSLYLCCIYWAVKLRCQSYSPWSKPALGFLANGSQNKRGQAFIRSEGQCHSGPPSLYQIKAVMIHMLIAKAWVQILRDRKLSKQCTEKMCGVSEHLHFCPSLIRSVRDFGMLKLSLFSLTELKAVLSQDSRKVVFFQTDPIFDLIVFIPDPKIAVNFDPWSRRNTWSHEFPYIILRKMGLTGLHNSPARV